MRSVTPAKMEALGVHCIGIEIYNTSFWIRSDKGICNVEATNVLLITIDSLRADRFLRDETRESLEIYDQIRDANGGTEFTRAFATGPGTTPSFPGILTGTYPLSMGGFEPLDPSRPFLAKTLKSAGFHTASFTSNPFLSSTFNYDTGFDEFVDYQNALMGLATKLFPRGIEDSVGPLQTINKYTRILDLLKKTYETFSGKSRPYVPAEVISDDGIEWLERVDQPFFGWLHYMDVHHPCDPPEEYRDRFDVDPDVDTSTVSDFYSSMVSSPEELTDAEVETLVRLYGAAVAYVNDQIERVFETLRQEGLWEDTLVIVTSDHGELFGEHDKYAKPEYLYDELLHVPLLATNVPERVADGHDDLVSLLDIPPLVHEVLEVEPDSRYTGQVPGIEPREYVLAEHKRQKSVVVGARADDWRYVHDEIRGEDRLFDLDDGERVSVTGRTDDEDVELLRRAVQSRLNDVAFDTEGLDLDDDVERRLKHLGYKV